MTYDNTDTNADGAIDAPIDNDSVSAGSITDSDDGPGGSLLGQDNLRAVFVDAVASNIDYRDTTTGDLLPWNE